LGAALTPVPCADLPDDQKEQRTAAFSRAMAAFEAVDDYYGLRGFGAAAADEASRHAAAAPPS
jgi:hypothetical protein